MKFLNSSELSKLVIEEGRGHNYIFYSFKEIKNPPSIKIDIDTNIPKGCTCKHHSIKNIHCDIDDACRYMKAVSKFLKNDKNTNK